jgi:hypothetical protein
MQLGISADAALELVLAYERSRNLNSYFRYVLFRTSAREYRIDSRGPSPCCTGERIQTYPVSRVASLRWQSSFIADDPVHAQKQTAASLTIALLVFPMACALFCLAPTTIPLVSGVPPSDLPSMGPPRRQSSMNEGSHLTLGLLRHDLVSIAASAED